MQRHVIALGGGGFSGGPRNLALDEYILSLTSRSKPRVCFLPTASGDSPLYIKRFYRTYEKLGARASHLSLFQPTPQPANKVLSAQDVIYVGGGTTRIGEMIRNILLDPQNTEIGTRCEMLLFMAARAQMESTRLCTK